LSRKGRTRHREEMGTVGQLKTLRGSVDGSRPTAITVQPGTHTVYCDEAGFTGNNLLDHQQPFFAYSAVAIEAAEAAEIVEHIMRDRGVQSGELKAANLVKSPRGQQTMLRVLHAIEGRYAVTFHDKKYALACKFFEYIFEPALQRNNKFFYDVEFNKFVANVLYLHFRVGEATAEEIMSDFQALMRRRDDKGLRRLFGSAAGVPGLAEMCDFALGCRDAINEELDALAGSDAVDKWVLDLTSASLVTLLAHWGGKLEQLDVYCDKSKPLQAGPGILEAMIGREERLYINFAGRELPMTFNLLRLPEFVDSKSQPGIQLADVVSGAAAFGLRDPGGEGRELLAAVQPHWTPHRNVFPELEHVDLREKGPCLNACLLRELAARGRQGFDPLYGIVEFYAFLDAAYDRQPPAVAEQGRRLIRRS
jgi:hypothetical protein